MLPRSCMLPTESAGVLSGASLLEKRSSSASGRYEPRLSCSAITRMLCVTIRVNFPTIQRFFALSL